MEELSPQQRRKQLIEFGFVRRAIDCIESTDKISVLEAIFDTDIDDGPLGKTMWITFRKSDDSEIASELVATQTLGGEISPSAEYEDLDIDSFVVLAISRQSNQ